MDEQSSLISATLITHDMRKLDRTLIESRRKKIISTAIIGLGVAGVYGMLPILLKNVDVASVQISETIKNSIEAFKTNTPIEISELSAEAKKFIRCGIVEIVSLLAVGKGLKKRINASKDYNNANEDMYRSADEIASILDSASRGGR